MSEMYPTLSNAWADQLRRLIVRPEHVTSPRGMATRERTFTQLEVFRPLSFPLEVVGREFRDAIPVLEGLSMVGQIAVTELFTDRIRKFHDFTDDGVFHGAYGARVHGQVGDVVRLLKRDPDSRQAVITIFDGTRDLDRQKRDIPCTIAMQFLLRDGELDARVTMRSNDVWLGMPYDMVQFAILQAVVAQAVGAIPGVYAHAAGSLHLYERDIEKATAVTMATGSTRQMAFPLFPEDYTLHDITGRARRILLDPQKIKPQTQFEEWACAALSS